VFLLHENVKEYYIGMEMYDYSEHVQFSNTMTQKLFVDTITTFKNG